MKREFKFLKQKDDDAFPWCFWAFLVWHSLMNRRIQHRVLEDTEPGNSRNLCVLQNSVLNQWFAKQGRASLAPAIQSAGRLEK